MTKPTILVVDDEDLIRWSLRERLTSDGYHVLEADTASAAVAACDETVDLVLLDYRLPDDDGLRVLKKIKQRHPDTLVIMLTAHTNVETVVEAMRGGAFDYATKPFDLDDVALRVARAMETTRLRRELRTLRASLSKPFGIESVIGESDVMQRVKLLVCS